MGPGGPPRLPYNDHYRPEPYQPPPPGIKDSPTNGYDNINIIFNIELDIKKTVLL